MSMFCGWKTLVLTLHALQNGLIKHKSAPKNIDEFVLFVDNLTAQQPDDEGNKWVDKEEDRSVDDDCMVFSQWMICRRN